MVVVVWRASASGGRSREYSEAMRGRVAEIRVGMPYRRYNAAVKLLRGRTVVLQRWRSRPENAGVL